MRLSSEGMDMDVCTCLRVIQKGRRRQVQKSSQAMTNPLGNWTKIIRFQGGSDRVGDLLMSKRKERLMQNWNWRAQQCQWKAEGAGEEVSHRGQGQTECHVLLWLSARLLSLVRDRALSRKAFSSLSLCLFLTAQRPCWHNHLVAENLSPSIPRQLSVRVWVPHPQEPSTSSSVYLTNTVTLYVAVSWKMSAAAFDTCKMILLPPVYRWWFLNLKLLPCFFRSTCILHYTHSSFFFKRSDFYWFKW